MFALVGPEFRWDRLHDPASVVAFEWLRARFHGVPVVPVLVEGGKIPPASEVPSELRWLTWNNAPALRHDSLSSDVAALIASLHLIAVREPRPTARVLWVDDYPANNEKERKALRPHGIVFDNVVSAEEALEQLRTEAYDLVITDLGRKGSSDRSEAAGDAFLAHPVIRGGGPPVIVYGGSAAVARRDALMALGANWVTRNQRELHDRVLRVLGRAPRSTRNLER
jgi:CheY-like chemotaxis protein